MPSPGATLPAGASGWSLTWKFSVSPSWPRAESSHPEITEGLVILMFWPHPESPNWHKLRCALQGLPVSHKRHSYNLGSSKHFRSLHQKLGTKTKRILLLPNSQHILIHQFTLPLLPLVSERACVPMAGPALCVTELRPSAALMAVSGVCQ